MTTRKQSFIFRDREIEVKELYHITDYQAETHKIICSFEAQSCAFGSQGEWCYYSIEIPKDQYNIDLAKTKIIDGMNKDYYRWDEKE